MAWTPPTDWVPGRGLTAAQLQTDVSDDLSAIGQWQAWTPVWSGAGSNPTIGNGTMAGRYTRIGGLVIAQMQLLMGSTTTYGSGAWYWSLPVQASPSQPVSRAIGVGWTYDAGVLTSMCEAWLAPAGSTSKVAMYAAAGASLMRSTVPFTWVTGDFLSWRVIYEGA